MKIQLNVEEIANKLFRYVPKMNPDEQLLSLSLYKSLAKGNPVSAEELAEEAQASTEKAESFLKDRFGVYANSDGKVIGYLGLAISEMGYALNVSGKNLYTWCAWDSLFIPPLLEEPARVKTKDPETGKDLEIKVSENGEATSDSGEIHMSILIPDVSEEEFAAGLEKDIISSFCHHVYFFESGEAADKFVSEREEQYAILSLDEATKLSNMWNEFVHGEALTKQEFVCVAC